jgi:hypothetical protein
MDVLLSLDYEIFGNGAGDVMRDVVRPTQRLLSLFDRYNTKVTIMLEVAEYWAFERYDRRLREDLGYSPCDEIRAQVLDAVRRGHDVQLHLHPQWIGAAYDQGRWRLQNSCWRLADLRDGLGDEDRMTSVVGALHAGRQTLEQMIRPVNVDYTCVCFRAGGFYAQPSRDVIAGLKRAGLRADSSVVKEYRTDIPFEVDYSRAVAGKTAWWTTDTELMMEGAPGENVLELAVNSRVEPYWNSFRKAKLRAAWQRLRSERMSRPNHTECRKISSVPGCWTVLRKLLRKHVSAFDFCKLSCRNMVKRMEDHAQDSGQPVVVIGHSKDFVNDQQLDRFLAWLTRNRAVSPVTFSEYIRRRLENQ